jgi:hypothetical protein
MRAHEFIVETAEENKIIFALANSINNSVEKMRDAQQKPTSNTIYGYLTNSNLTKESVTTTVNKIIDDLNIKVDENSRNKIFSLLYKLLFVNLIFITLPEGTKGGWDNKNTIYISNEFLKRLHVNASSTIAHEMTHAIDYFKSNGKYGQYYSDTTHKYSHEYPADQKYSDYLRNPHEINARFQQALEDFTYNIFKKISNTETNFKISPNILNDLTNPNNIKMYLDQNNITRDLFSNRGQKGNQRYNHLFTRFVKFIEVLKPDLQSIIDEKNKNMPAQTLSNNIKTLYQKAIGYAKAFAASLF